MHSLLSVVFPSSCERLYVFVSVCVYSTGAFIYASTYRTVIMNAENIIFPAMEADYLVKF